MSNLFVDAQGVPRRRSGMEHTTAVGVTVWDATWDLKQFYDHEYRTKLIARLASVGNPEACFYAGMRVVFVEDHNALMPRLNMLERSTTAGHDVAAFVLSLVLHRSNSGAGNDNIA